VSTRRSLAFSLLDRYASLIVNVLSSMVLARLLTPADVGVFSVTMVLLALVSTIRDMGSGDYVTQERELTTARLRSVWAVQLGAGMLLALLVLIVSVPIAEFYQEPRLRGVMWIVALNYATNPFGMLTYALLMRDMRFGPLAVIRLSSTVMGAMLSIVLAWRGYGPFSLAWGSVASTATGAIVSFAFRPRECPWLPGLSEIRRVLSFGTRLTGTSVIETLIRGTPEFFLGKLQGFAAAGLYSRANGLVQLFNRLVVDAVYPVALASFSKESRADGNVVAPFRQSLVYVTALACPFAVAVSLLAHPLIRLLYGNQWDQSVDLTRMLAVWAALVAPIPLCHAALVATGQAARIFRASLASAVVVLASVSAAAVHGLPWVGAAVVLSGLVSVALWLRAASATVPFGWGWLASSMLPNVWLSAGAACAPALATTLWGSAPIQPLPSLALGGIGAVVGFVAVVKWTRHPLAAELDRLVANLLRRMPADKRGADA
jgi:O-antigen/teichoic acid export membrane protein